MIDNLEWMFNEAVKKGGTGTFNGYLLLDEMSIQQDLQVVKRGKSWSLVGAVDLGSTVNSLDGSLLEKENCKLAMHCFQYMYVGCNGFRWPIAYFGSDNVNGHSIYLMMWPLRDQLQSFGFNIHGAIMDGSSNNRQFTRLMIDTNSARLAMNTTFNPFKVSQKFALIQDCKHVFKKIRNSLLSSTPNGRRQILLNGKFVYWSYFQEAYMYNMKREFRYFRHLTREHVFLNAQAKMRNHLATDVLGTKMLILMQNYKLSLTDDGNKLDSLISLLEVTSKMVDFFSNTKMKISTVKDGSVYELLECLSFFHKWELQHESQRKNEALNNKGDQTRYRFLYLWFHSPTNCCGEIAYFSSSRLH